MNPALQADALFGTSSNPFEEAGATALLEAADNLSARADHATRSRNPAWVRQTQSEASKLATLAGSFVKQALIIAAAKFVLELCALVINHTMDALKQRGKGRIDFTTPNVAYASNGMPPGGPAPSGDYRNPFASAFGGSSNVGLF
jgi:hypothetical protein